MDDRQCAEGVLLVVIQMKRWARQWTMEELCAEMRELVSACGGEVVGMVEVKLDRVEAGCFIGEGKLREITGICGVLPVDTVIFSQDLKGSQQRNLEERLGKKVIDRTQLILDIFARHARTREAQMQVELAQLEYLLPRLVGKGVELSRLGGGIGTLGPGETKLEVDRRRIGARIARLKKELQRASVVRALKRKKRKDRHIPAISLVGYTNAGKSTLLNRLTRAGQVTRDGMFTTLDSLSRQLVLPNHQQVILSDTVGFMRQLPHHLIEAFKTTLEEVAEADLLVRVLDVSRPNVRALHEAVDEVLKEIGAYDKPAIVVLNKIDRLDDRAWLEVLKDRFAEAVCVSAVTGENIDVLLKRIEQKLSGLVVEIDVNVPIQRMDLVNLAHEAGEVLAVKYYEKQVNIRAVVPAALSARFYGANKER